MRSLHSDEVEAVAGGDWSLGFDLKIVKGEISGDESVQEIAQGVAGLVGGAYDTTRDWMTDLFENFALGWAYSARCGM